MRGAAMAEEEDGPWVKATQDSLGKLITKPKLTDKYLKKPPFRFLHDIVMEVVKASTFMQGLYTPEETDAAQLSDKTAKVEFLNKALSVVSFALGEKVDVSANKIVAGLEADKTNLFLQKLYQAASTCAGPKSDDAVQRVLSGETVSAPKKDKKDKKDGKDEAPAAAAPPPADDAAAAEEDKRKKDEARRKKRDEEKRKKAEEEAAEAPPAPLAPLAPAVDHEAAAEEEKKRKKEEERKLRKQKEKEAAAAAEAEAAAAARAQAEADAYAQQQWAAQQQQAEWAAQQQASAQAAAEEQEQQRIASSPPPDHFPEGGPPSAPGSAAQGMRPSPEDIAASAAASGMLQEDPTRQRERPRTAGRRPPKVTSKVKESSEPTSGAPVAAPIILAETGKQDVDDDDCFEAPPDQLPGFGASVKADEGGVHGKFVSNLLAEKRKEQEAVKAEEERTREEVEDETGNGIKMGKLKRKDKNKESTAAEVDTGKLGAVIQNLCQAANPLGKSIDLVHQDIAHMGKEMDQWRQEYREASDVYNKEVLQTESMLQPLYQKLAELDDKIAEQKTKIRNSKSRITQNDQKIQLLLTSVVSTNKGYA